MGGVQIVSLRSSKDQVVSRDVREVESEEVMEIDWSLEM
jgi:hypothetical protein